MSIICSLMVLLECKTEKGNADSQWSKQVLFARANKVWLAVNHKLSVTSGEWLRCSKRTRIARASELDSCQSYLCLPWGYERLQNLKIHLKLHSL